MKDYKILITGGQGFLGKHVVANLMEKGYDKVITPRHARFDLREPAEVERMFNHYLPDIVIHLAANVGGIGYNQAKPADLFYDNITMGVNVIHTAQKYEVAKLVLVGTVCAYPKHTPIPFKECDIWNGYPEETNAPYGIAKKALLVQAQAYRTQFGLNSIYLLPVNLYGPHDNFDEKSSHVIPALIHKITEAKRTRAPSVEIWGSGNPTREFLYVEDAAEGIVLAMERFNGAEPVNLGSGNEISIFDLATQIKLIIGYTGELIFNHRKPDGQPKRCLDVTLAYDRFGFKATTNFEEGLKKTIQWFSQS